MKIFLSAVVFLSAGVIYSQNIHSDHLSTPSIIESSECELKDKDRIKGDRKHRDGKKKDKRNKDKSKRSEWSE